MLSVAPARSEMRPAAALPELTAELILEFASAISLFMTSILRLMLSMAPSSAGSMDGSTGSRLLSTEGSGLRLDTNQWGGLTIHIRIQYPAFDKE